MSGAWLVSYLLLWAFVLVLSLMLAGVLRYLASMQEKFRLAAPPISRFELGERVPEFTLASTTGTSWSSRYLATGDNHTLLLFATPSCHSCITLFDSMDEIASRPVELRSTKTSIVLILVGNSDEISNLTLVHPHWATDMTVLIDEHAEAMRECGISSVPIGILVDPRGAVADQSLNPHIHWIYRKLDLAVPKRERSDQPVALMLPVMQYPD